MKSWLKAAERNRIAALVFGPVLLAMALCLAGVLWDVVTSGWVTGSITLAVPIILCFLYPPELTAVELAGLFYALALKVEHRLGAGSLGLGAANGGSGIGDEHPYVVELAVAIVAAVEEEEALENGARGFLGHVVHALGHDGAGAQALD